jgi:hypothetical protein
MKVDQINVGGFYVNQKKGLIREIVSEESDGKIYWRSYSLDDGEPVAHRRSLCSKQAILQWADREADAVEIAGLKRAEAQAQEQKEGMELIDHVLKEIPDKMLLAEVRRRGLIKDS